ncbi:MAG: hypothetical protein J7515_03810 [Caulobacter sp.]|nr:hypothetical protein [Caulobacter sp.]
MKPLALAGVVATSAALIGGSEPAITEFEREAAQARVERFEGVAPTAGFTRSDSLTGAWSVVSVYVQGPRSPRGRWVARRVASDTGSPVWTDAATCPGLARSLARLERLSPQRLEILGVSPRSRPRAYAADGAVQTVWTSGGARPDGAPITVEWSANSGDLAAWGRATEEGLAKCWKPKP